MKVLLIGMAALVLALAATILVLSSGTESLPTPPPPVGTQVQPKPKDTGSASSETLGRASIAGNPATEPAAPAAEAPAELNPESRMAIIQKIQDAIATYSDEGVAVVEPMLASADAEIRETAVEAMKQLATPGAAESLRRAAQKSTTSPLERRMLLDAANFIDLPPHQFTPKPPE